MGGTSWPRDNPPFSGDRVYFGSADGYLYCLDRNSGVLLEVRTEDSLKTTPTIPEIESLSAGLITTSGVECQLTAR